MVWIGPIIQTQGMAAFALDVLLGRLLTRDHLLSENWSSKDLDLIEPPAVHDNNLVTSIQPLSEPLSLKPSPPTARSLQPAASKRTIFRPEEREANAQASSLRKVAPV